MVFAGVFGSPSGAVGHFKEVLGCHRMLRAVPEERTALASGQASYEAGALPGPKQRRFTRAQTLQCFELAVLPAFLPADRSSSVAESGSSGAVGSGSAGVSGGAAALGAGLVWPWISDVQRKTYAWRLKT